MEIQEIPEVNGLTPIERIEFVNMKVEGLLRELRFDERWLWNVRQEFFTLAFGAATLLWHARAGDDENCLQKAESGWRNAQQKVFTKIMMDDGEKNRLLRIAYLYAKHVVLLLFGNIAYFQEMDKGALHRELSIYSTYVRANATDCPKCFREVACITIEVLGNGWQMF